MGSAPLRSIHQSESGLKVLGEEIASCYIGKGMPDLSIPYFFLILYRSTSSGWLSYNLGLY